MTEADVLTTAAKAVEIYASRHPRPSHVTARQAAEMMSVSTATVTRMIKAGTLRLNRVGRIPTEMVDAALQARR
jgi:excisionase family DNA binding protein